MITMANLIVSTTNNNQPMNEAVKQVAARVMTGQKGNHRRNDECCGGGHPGL